MAPRTVTVKYSKPGTQPPIFLAGSFSDPAWHPQEMEYTTDKNNEHEFYKKVQVEGGKEYQYKFRLGLGDWWTLNEDSPTVTDDIGNKNNLLSIPKIEEKATDSEEQEPIPREPEPEQTDSTPPAEMEKEKTPSIEETMGTRETDDALFADEIIKDMDKEKEEVKAPAVEEPVEPHPTPAIPEKPQTEHIEEAKHTNEVQDVLGIETSERQTIEEEVIEPIPAPVVDIKKIQDFEETDSKDVSDDQMEEDKAVAPPALVVENAESEPKQEEKSSAGATHVGHDSDHLQASETTEDMVSRNGSRTPELADVAAEVAETAATLDREEPGPPISDEEAGRIGFRRMSSTPIPQVALTAAEKPQEFVRPFDVDDGPLPETPPNEKVPQFSHECCSPSDHVEPCQHEEFDPYEGMRPRIEEEIDLNDPSIKMFPTDRAGILEHLRRLQERLPEDEVKLDLAPRSPVMDPNIRLDKLNLSAVSPIVLAQRSPSLCSIPEDNGEGSNVLASSPVKLNGEDKLATNGINVTKEEIPTIVPLVTKEDAASSAEPDKKAQNLTRSEVGSDNSALHAGLEQLVTNITETDIPHLEEPAEDAPTKLMETVKKEMVGETQDPEPVKSIEEGASNEATSIPKVADQETPAEEASTQNVGESSMDGVCSEDLHVVPNPMTPLIVGDRQLGHDDEAVRELTTGTSSPNIVVQPATPFPGIDRQLGQDEEQSEQATTKDAVPDAALSPATIGSSTVTDTAIKQNNTAKSTAVTDESDDTQVKSRKRQPSPAQSPERPTTPSSVRSAGKDVKDRSFMKAFWNLVFVDWIGGFFMRLCGGRRRRL
ncbi:hypothetical protein EG329_005077 [Mollisiaceae sp. DMI_Dod_QoI]|nr:hypothetical protein EG329_005077 [Helotiales sp. DMI_Dod_QoI]